MKHLSDSQLSARLDGALSGADLSRVKAHLGACEECRSRFEALTDEERALRKALEHDPGEAYFATFADRVQGRLRAEGLAGAQARERGNIAGWFGRPRNLAIAGAVATVIVGAGIVLINSREVEMPTLRRIGAESHAVAPAPTDLGAKESAPSATGATEPSADGSSTPSAVAHGESAPSSDTRERGADVPPASALGAASGGATPQRAYEVRRDANGEDVPVNPPHALLSPITTPANALQPEIGGRRVIKQRKAEPMGAAPTTQSPGASSAPSGVPPGPDTAPLLQKSAPASSPASGGPAPSSALTPSASEPAPSASAPTASRRTAKAAPPLPAPHSITTPSVTSRTQEREEHAPVRPVDAQAKRSLVIDEKQAAGTELCGQVLDNSGRVVSAAEVRVAETGVSTRTDASGHFCIRAPIGDRTVVVMAEGYEELRRPVAVTERSSEMALVVRSAAVQAPPSGAPSTPVYSYVTPPRDGVAPNALGPRDSASPGPTASLDKRARNTSGFTKSLYGTGPSASTLDQLVSEAQRISTDAAKDGSASHFEAAANAWERVMPLVRGKPAEHEVRFHVAEQRYLAWQAHPTHSRSLAAHAALTAYVLRAPAGPDRDRATRWLGFVKP